MITTPDAVSPTSVASHYDELDVFYRDIWGDQLHHGLWDGSVSTAREAARRMIDYVVEQIDLQPGEKVCDVGSGYGSTARILARDQGLNVTALTVSERQHRYALQQEAQKGNPRYLLRDWFDNELPSQHYHGVIAVESLSHMNDKRGFFQEAFRVLKPGGRILICVWMSGSSPGWWQRRFFLQPLCSEGKLAGLATEEEYKDWVVETGFRLTSFHDLTNRVQRTWRYCMRKLLQRFFQDSRYRDFLWNSRNQNRSFVLSPLRIWCAYRIGAMRYGVLLASKER